MNSKANNVALTNPPFFLGHPVCESMSINWRQIRYFKAIYGEFPSSTFTDGKLQIAPAWVKFWMSFGY